jgi:hypothetical protein
VFRRAIALERLKQLDQLGSFIGQLIDVRTTVRFEIITCFIDGKRNSGWPDWGIATTPSESKREIVKRTPQIMDALSHTKAPIINRRRVFELFEH